MTRLDPRGSLSKGVAHDHGLYLSVFDLLGLCALEIERKETVSPRAKYRSSLGSGIGTCLKLPFLRQLRWCTVCIKVSTGSWMIQKKKKG